jgi:hypothetical protein
MVLFAVLVAAGKNCTRDHQDEHYCHKNLFHEVTPVDFLKTITPE